MVIRLLMPCFVMLLLSSSYCYAERETLVYVDSDDLPPYLYHTKSSSLGKSFAGISLDVIKKIIEPLNYDVELNIKPALRVFADLHSGKADIGYLYRSNDRLGEREYPAGILYCEKPVFDLSVGLYALNKDEALIESLGDMKNHRLGRLVILPDLKNKASLNESNTRKIVSYANLKQMFKALLHDRVDFIESPRHHLIPKIFFEYSQGKELDWIMEASKMHVFLAISSATERGETLKAEVCQRAEFLTESGELRTIVDNYRVPKGVQLLDIIN